jgi:hypothetical protein
MDRLSSTAKKNYTEVGLGNDLGHIKFGHINQKGDVTMGVCVGVGREGSDDSRHQLSFELDGKRKGFTTLTTPTQFRVECGRNCKEEENALNITAQNGDISIAALNGKIRLSATCIEINATGEGSSKGLVKVDATESVKVSTKKLLVNTSTIYKLVSTGTGEIVANTALKMYASIVKGVTDAVKIKDSKNLHQQYQRDNMYHGPNSAFSAQAQEVHDQP